MQVLHIRHAYNKWEIDGEPSPELVFDLKDLEYFIAKNYKLLVKYETTGYHSVSNLGVYSESYTHQEPNWILKTDDTPATFVERLTTFMQNIPS